MEGLDLDWLDVDALRRHMLAADLWISPLGLVDLIPFVVHAITDVISIILVWTEGVSFLVHALCVIEHELTLQLLIDLLEEELPLLLLHFLLSVEQPSH